MPKLPVQLKAIGAKVLNDRDNIGVTRTDLGASIYISGSLML